MCGAALVPEESVLEVRKTVTVVFADVAGSTALGERLDPEATRRIMGRYFDEAQAALERHGGSVEKFIGDAVMAVFGIPQVHEDDALRAVRAAADVRSAVERLGAELEPELGVRLRARIGVNTGEIVAGDPSAGQRFATGDAVNVAARLEQAAPPGEVLLGDATRRLAGDAIDAERVEPLALKGKMEAVRAWRLVGVRPDMPAFTRRIDAPFVGRAAEVGVLEAAFGRAVAQREAQLCTIVGPPGIGKSRLAREVLGRIGDNARILVGRCLPYGEGITYWPLAEIVKQLGEERGVRQALAGDDELERVADRVLAAVGLGDGGAGAEETAWAFRRLFEALADDEPLVLVLDDIHWAESTLLDLLEYLVTFSADAPLLLLCLARADLFDARPSWAAPRRNAALVTLEPLADAESEALVEQLLAERPIAEAARQRILAAAEGNPLFVEQLLAYTADGPALAEATVPPTLHALLAARIDALAPEERAVAQRASVEGRSFHRGAVAELLPEPARPRLGSQLMALVRKELIRPDRASFASDDGFRFGHILIRDAAYDAMPKLLRAELHERYALWLERAAAERVSEYEELLGYHLEQAHRLRVDVGPADERSRRLAEAAGQRLGAAGERAFGRSDMAAAANLLGRAWDLLQPDDARRLDHGLHLTVALWLLGDLPNADRVSAEVYERAGRRGDQRLRARARIERLDGHYHLDIPMEQMRQELAAAIEIFEAAGDEGGLAVAWRIVGMTHWMENRAGDQAEALERALTHARRLGADAPELTPILSQLATGLSHGPMPVDEAFAKCEELLALAPRNLLVEASVKRALGRLRAMQGRVEEADALMRRGVGITQELGLTLQAAAAGGQGGAFVADLAGDLPRAVEVLRESVRELEEAGERSYLSTNAALLADVLVRLGEEDAEAERLADLARAISPEDDRSSQVGWRIARARLLARRGEHAEAQALAREAVRRADETDFLSNRGEAWLALADVLRADGRTGEATEAAECALRLFEAKGNVAQAGHAREFLASDV